MNGHFSARGIAPIFLPTLSIFPRLFQLHLERKPNTFDRSFLKKQVESAKNMLGPVFIFFAAIFSVIVSGAKTAWKRFRGFPADSTPDHVSGKSGTEDFTHELLKPDFLTSTARKKESQALLRNISFSSDGESKRKTLKSRLSDSNLGKKGCGEISKKVGNKKS